MTRRQQRIVALALLAAAGTPLSSACASALPAPAGAVVQAAQKPNGSGVDIRYRVLDKPAVGQPVRVEIALGRVKDSAGAVLRFSADPGLRLGSGSAPTSLPAGETTTLTVTVVPQEEGLAYLNVFTTQRGATSSTSIPIQTGAAAAGSKKAGAGKLKDTPEGDKILSIPVK